MTTYICHISYKATPYFDFPCSSPQTHTLSDSTHFFCATSAIARASNLIAQTWHPAAAVAVASQSYSNHGLPSPPEIQTP
jgi:hypothetical protein